MSSPDSNVIERALSIGNGWDQDIYFDDTGVSIRQADGGTITFEDLAGNDMLVLADISTTSDHVLSIDSDTQLVLDSAADSDIDLTTVAGEALVIESGTTGAITIGGDASAETINIGTGGAVKTIVFGNTGQASVVDFNSGAATVNAVDFALNSVTTANGIDIVVNGLTTGHGVKISSSQTSTNQDGYLLDVSSSGSNAGNDGGLARFTVNGALNDGGAGTTAAVMITNLGAGRSFQVNDETGDSDASPFVIDTAGNVCIGACEANKLTVLGNIAISGTSGVFRRNGVDGGTISLNCSGASSSVDTLETTGGIVTASACGSTVTSDARLKENVQEFSALDKVNQLRAVSFEFNDLFFQLSGKDREKYGVQYGFIAQEVAEIFPELIVETPYGDYKGINYQAFFGILAQAIQEVDEKVDMNIDQLLATEALVFDRLGELEDRVAQLEAQGAQAQASGSSANIDLADGEAFRVNNSAGANAASIDGAGNAFFAGSVAADDVRGQQIIGTDIGQRFSSSENLELGDVVALVGDGTSVRKTNGARDTAVVGVISSGASMVVGEPAGSGSEVLVAVSGQVSVKVSTEAGNIQPGDGLTPSSTAGVAMKARTGDPIIGRAVSGYDVEGSVGRVVAVVTGGYFTDSADATNLAALNNRVANLEQQVSDLQTQGTSSSSDQSQLEGMQVDESNFVTMENLRVTGALIVDGPAEFRGETIFHKLVTFVQKVIFKNDVAFEGRATFNNDTAGFAVIKSGQSFVEVKFSQPYVQLPVITATASNGQFVQYAVTEMTPDGFKIILAVPATGDVMFNWHATAVDNAQVSQQP